MPNLARYGALLLLASLLAAYSVNGGRSLAGETAASTAETPALAERWDDPPTPELDNPQPLRLGLNLSKDETALREAKILTIRTRLTEKDPTQAPVEWAKLQFSLALLHLDLGVRNDDAEHLEKAADACRAVLELLDRETASHDRGAVWWMLGTALAESGQIKRDAERLELALAAFRRALQFAPLLQPIIEPEIANTLLSVGELRADPARLREAAAAFRQMLTGGDGYPDRDWIEYHLSLGIALRTLALLKDDPALLTQSVAALEAAVELGRDFGLLEEDLPRVQYNLGSSLLAQALASGMHEKAGQAVSAIRHATEGWTQQYSPRLWAHSRYLLSVALVTQFRIGLSRAKGAKLDLPLLAEAHHAATDAYRVMIQELGLTDHAEAFAAQLAYVEQARETLEFQKAN